jgi:hypothetical protein
VRWLGGVCATGPRNESGMWVHLHPAAYSAGRAVAQGRVPVSVVVFVLEVADDHTGLEQGVPVIAVEALLPKLPLAAASSLP